ncbi:MAG: IPT/TIG domain-containing protein, partial [Planctomycetota bacterium]
MQIFGVQFAAGATVTICGTAATAVNVLSSTHISCDTPAGTPGFADVTVNSGGESDTLVGGFLYLGNPPDLQSILPTSGPEAGGTSIVLSGTDFQTGATVTVGGNACSNYVYLGVPTNIICDVPAGTGTADVVITNPDTQFDTLAAAFTYIPAPAVTGINPTSGPTAGGTSVTITGTDFQSGATVTIGGTSATNVAFVNVTTITCDTPSGSAGAADVVVTNPDTQNDTLAGGFTYIPPPTVSSINPTSGTTGGGTPVTVSGTDFQSGATVTIGGTSASSVVFVNTTTITCNTPAGSAGAADVVVTNPDTQSDTLTGGFTFVLPPTVSGVNPTFGPMAGGTGVTISGTDFQSGATITLGGNPATSIVFVNTTTLTCNTPAGIGTVDVVVTNPDSQLDTLTGGFTYIGSLTVSLGAKTPGNLYSWNDAPKLEVLQFKLEALSEGVNVTSVMFTHTGTGNPSAASSAAMLFEDVNADGWYTAGLDTQIGTNQTFAGTTVTFSGLTETVAAGSPEHWLLVYDLTGAATPAAQGDTFKASIASSADLVATGSITSASITPFGLAPGGRWKTVSNQNAPAARWMPSMVNTGTKIIVWGGGNSSNELNTGGVYDIATDTWSPTTITNAPIARADHRAVWTGSGMVVWGGSNSGTPLATGAVYDPLADSWTTMSTTGAPSARRAFSMIWNGTRVIVWGGENSGTRYNDGFTYNPGLNTWTPIGTAGAPAARNNIQGVWTGNRMLVWGGWVGSDTNTGGIYNPAANNWKAMTTTGAPTPRMVEEGCVWTGERMIVWGGMGGSGSPYHNTGGMYDPWNNTWTAMPVAGAPSARWS